jgi:hypothetical protein
MAATFAARESRLNRAVFTHLSNVDATINAVLVSGIFDDGYALGSVGTFGMATTQPTLTLSTADVPASVVGTSVVVGAQSYLVASHEPDGAGVSRLMLEVAS